MSIRYYHVSRFFAPRAGIPEDPVTGSAHCTLVPYWARRLGKRSLSVPPTSLPGRRRWMHYGRGSNVVRVILSVVALVLIAVLIILNVGKTTSFNLFGFTIANLNVVAIAIGGFIAGVLYSFLYLLVSSIGRGRRVRLKERHARVQERERTLARREEELRGHEDAGAPAGGDGGKRKPGLDRH